MANRPINTPRGIFVKDNIGISANSGNGFYFFGYSTTTVLVSANSTGLTVAGGVKVSGQANATLTGNSTGVVVAGAVRVSNAKYISANTTGFVFTAAATKPSTRSASKWAFITNSTGVNSIAVNTTGTTWKYLSLTSTLNSTAGYP